MKRISQQKSLKTEEPISLGCPGSFSLVSFWLQKMGGKKRTDLKREWPGGSPVLPLASIPGGDGIFTFPVPLRLEALI